MRLLVLQLLLHVLHAQQDCTASTEQKDLTTVNQDTFVAEVQQFRFQQVHLEQMQTIYDH